MKLFCCKALKRNLENCEGGLAYVPKFRYFGIAVLDGGSSTIKIEFCPWCGHKLPPDLSDEWLSQIEALNLEPGDPKIPAELLTDEWWKNHD